MYLGDEKKNKNSYLPAMFGCLMPCPRAMDRTNRKNNQPPEQKRLLLGKQKRTINLCKTKRKNQLLDRKQNHCYAPGCFMFLGDETKTAIYQPCLAVQCHAPGTMDRKNGKNNQSPEQKRLLLVKQKEQSTCAEQKEKISCQTENKTNAMLPDVSHTWEMKRKRKTAIYQPCLAV